MTLLSLIALVSVCVCVRVRAHMHTHKLMVWKSWVEIILKPHILRFPKRRRLLPNQFVLTKQNKNDSSAVSVFASLSLSYLPMALLREA